MDPGQFAAIVICALILGYASFAVWLIRFDTDENTRSLHAHDAVLDVHQAEIDRLKRAVLGHEAGALQTGRHSRPLRPPNE